jgi:hypothetical protein
MFIGAFAAFVLAVGVVLLVAAAKDDTFSIQRVTRIAAAPESVFALLEDLRAWASWSSHGQSDPTMKRAYTGAAKGRGAVSEWESSGRAGKGRMEITECAPVRQVTVVVDWVKPFKAHNVNEFSLEADGALTAVTWAMHGTNVYAMKVMGLFANMDRVMGNHFETGLANLKRVAESNARRLEARDPDASTLHS